MLLALTIKIEIGIGIGVGIAIERSGVIPENNREMLTAVRLQLMCIYCCVSYETGPFDPDPDFDKNIYFIPAVLIAG